jgi:hypothetical protein
VHPGHIFVIDTGGGHGHLGLVVEVVGGKLITIEGNTNDGGSREGVGVFLLRAARSRRSTRVLSTIARRDKPEGLVECGHMWL